MEPNPLLYKALFYGLMLLSFLSILVLTLIILSLVVLYRQKKIEHFWHVIGWLIVFYLIQALKFIGENYYGTEI